MPRPSQLLATATTPEGPLCLYQQPNGQYTILVGGRMLMNSAARRSEEALARLGCAGLAGRARPRVLVGGLGMGLTLRATLDELGPDAQVVVAELNPEILSWNETLLAPLNGGAASDPRVTHRIGDVAQLISEAQDGEYDTILLDLYEGPRMDFHGVDHPLYGLAALQRSRRALKRPGVLAIWSEERDASFEATFRRAGFAVRTEQVSAGGGGWRHVIYLGETALPAKTANKPRALP